MRQPQIAIFGLGLLAASCGRRASEEASPAGQPAEVDPLAKAPRDPGRRLDLLVRAAVDAELQESPIAATSLGVHTADDRFDNLNVEAQLGLQNRLHQLLERLHGLNEAGLDAE